MSEKILLYLCRFTWTKMKLKLQLKNAFEKIPLPGYEAHKQMIPEMRPYNLPANDFKNSAVNIVLFEQKNRLKFILTKRSNKLKHHSGQISLPGGGFDENDENLWNTAKRETFEEIGLKIEDDNFIAKLSSITVPVSRFIVQPFVCFIDYEPTFILNAQEVQIAYTADVEKFFQSNNIKSSSMSKNGITFAYNYFILENQQVWGLTAMILAEFNYILQQNN